MLYRQKKNIGSPKNHSNAELLSLCRHVSGVAPGCCTPVYFRAARKSVIFACLNSPFKITPRYWDMWMRILKAVPNSVLWLRSFNFETDDKLKEEAKNGVLTRHASLYCRRCQHMPTFCIVSRMPTYFWTPRCITLIPLRWKVFLRRSVNHLSRRIICVTRFRQHVKCFRLAGTDLS